jgi:hypothetical protein
VGGGGEKRKRSRISRTFKSSVEDELCILQVGTGTTCATHTHTTHTYIHIHV